MKRLGLVLLFGVAACSGGSDVAASVISTLNTIGVGEQRILVEFDDDHGEVAATLRNENGSPLDEDVGELVFSEPGRSIYAFYFAIPEAETYQLTFDVGGDEAGPAGFVAVEDPIQVTVGGAAPTNSTGVLMFASGSNCPSRTCDAMAETVESVTGGGFVSFEVFVDPDSEEPALTNEVEAWGLPGQPWLYVVGQDGIVTAVFEGAVSKSELREALASG